MWIIYKVTFPNGKVYIGQTSRSLKRRKKGHYRDVAKEAQKSGENNKFHLALLKHSPDINDLGTTWEVIDTAETVEEALNKEAEYIIQYDSIQNGYNCRTSQNGKGFVSDETKQKISKAVGEHSKRMWADNPERRKKHSEEMKRRHANGEFDEAKRKSTNSRRTPESRKKTSEDNLKRYLNQNARDKMALALGGKPFLVYKDGELIGRFISIKEAYRRLNIPDNGHITTILKRGKGTLYGYTFIYETDTDLIDYHQAMGGKDESK